MVASAFPLAEVARRAADERAAAELRQGDGDGSAPGVDDLPFTVPGAGTTPSGETGSPFGMDGSSSRPGQGASQGRASASGSVLLSQVLGAADMMGYDVAVPELPTARIASDQPLRAAILAWIAATGSTVAPDELTQQLERADAMPLPLQRDLALLILSTIEATTLQRAALAGLTPAEIEWIQANPEVGEQMAQGIENPATRQMAILAGKVDMTKSIAATLLLLQAVEVTRGTLENASAQDALDGLGATELDATTRGMLALLAGAPVRTSDSEKVLLAAELVAMGAGIAVPAAAPAPRFADAVQALLTASGSQVDPTQLATVLDRAALLPDDLESAVARLVLAEAKAIDAANPRLLTPTSQSEALVAMLVATAEALPTLNKYNLYWSDAPDALRLSEWDAGARAGWAAHHAALLSAASGDLTDLAAASAIAAGHEAPPAVTVPARSFVEAYAATVAEAGLPLNDTVRAMVADAAATLDPATRDAAAILLSGAAESARLYRLAFADLTPAERDTLTFELAGIDALYQDPTPSAADLERLARASALAERVDIGALLTSRIAAAGATEQAERILVEAGAVSTMGDARVIPTGIRSFLERMMPFGTARAQGADCRPLPVAIVDTCGEDVLLRVYYPFPFGPVGWGEANGVITKEFVIRPLPGGRVQVLGIVADPGNVAIYPTFSYNCTPRECLIDFGGLANREMLVITGPTGSSHTPELTMRLVCAASQGSDGKYYPVLPCREEEVARYGAPTVTLDLGGDDRYHHAVAMVHLNASLPVSLHLDLAGNDAYNDPSPLYDELTPLVSALGSSAGHPSSASAPFGGQAILLDRDGNDQYRSSTRSQAYARLGFALLADLAGTDAYEGGVFVQGASSEAMNLGGAVLFDQSGGDRYTALAGQGYGLGGLLLDAGGKDRYINEQAPLGVPLAHFDVLPGGDLTTLDEREDGRFWLDGPGTVNIGLGVDTEVLAGSGGADSDGDGISDFAEIAAGTDPHDRRSNPVTNPAARAVIVTTDSDGDGWPDYIERAFSTDPDNGTGGDSYPAGLPSGLRVQVPATVYGATSSLTEGTVTENGTIDPTNVGGASETAPGFRGSDKIVDLRLPLQEAGSIDHTCTGTLHPNVTAPMGIAPGENFLYTNQSALAEKDEQGKPTDRCVYVSYSTTEPGRGNGTAPAADMKPHDFTYRIPSGILAIGDVVATKYSEDYFVVIDLGGADHFNNSAGGGLVVRTDPRPPEGEDAKNYADVDNAFIAPSLVVNVDRSANAASDATGEIVAAKTGDSYVNASRDHAHGSYFGVLVDTAGSDTYTARNVSQGALGGVLLDLGHADDKDTYTAGHLSQGAGLVGPPDPRRARPDMPADSSSDRARATDLPTAQRRLFPGLLLDVATGEPSMGTVRNTFSAQSYSQGFAQGFQYVGLPTNTSGSARTFGILASIGAKDAYVTAPGSRAMQGVGGTDGLGLLFDLGGVDSYHANGRVSQGATLPQVVGSGDAAAYQHSPHPALGILLDLTDAEKYDTYLVSLPNSEQVARNERNQNTTVQRDEAPFTSTPGPDTHLYVNTGIHIDARFDATDPTSAVDLVSGLGGAGDKDAISTNASAEFHVYLPTARLAIGKNGTTHYDHEFALAIDLGGRNAYNFSAGGHVRDTIAQYNGTGLATGGLAPATQTTTVSAFPVSLVVDAGKGRSEYNFVGSYAQGAGFFGVGVLADLGGEDRMRALGRPIPGLASGWMEGVPGIDGMIGTEWDTAVSRDVAFVALGDEDARVPWTIRVANDDRAIYIAVNGSTSSAPDQRSRDRLTINFDAGRRLAGWDQARDGAGIDQIVFTFDSEGACIVRDRYYDAKTRTYREDTIQQKVGDEEFDRFVGGCRYAENGEVFFELRKDLIETFPADKFDMAYCHVPDVGLGMKRTPASTCDAPILDLGLMFAFNDTGAGYFDTTTGAGDVPQAAMFVWPPGAAPREGLPGYSNNNDMSDEMARWGAVVLANEGVASAAPELRRTPMLSHGAGLGGVGVLAMLGSTGSGTIEGGDRAIGYGGFGGLGLVIDAGGSDSYSGKDRSLGAAETMAFGAVIEMGGNDNYLATNASLAWSPASGATSAFLDLGGDDAYGYIPRATMYEQSRLADREALTGVVITQPSPFNNMAWTQNASMGADYQLDDSVRNNLALLEDLYAHTSTTLFVTEYDPTDETGGRYGGGCTDRSVPAHDTKLLARGEVCFLAAVEIRNNTAEAQLSALRTGRAHLNVTSVDFTLDRQRVASAERNITIAPNLTVWSAVVNVSGIPDGVLRAKALPIFTAQVAGGDTYVFSDSTTNSIADSPTTRTLIINNEPAVAAALDPDFTGRANSTFSPYAYGPAQRLYTNFSVSRDANEFDLVAANNWRTPVWNTSYPCAGVPSADAEPQLCSTLPFYLVTGDVERLATEPGTNPAGSVRELQVETMGGETYAKLTAPLKAPLTIYRENGFHLTIPNRTTILPFLDYTTEIKIKLHRVNGNVVEEVGDGAGGSYLVATARGTSAPSTPNPDRLSDLFGAYKALADGAVDRVEQAEKDAQGPIVQSLIIAAYDTVDRTPPAQNVTRGWYHNMSMISGFRFCSPSPPKMSENLVGWALYTGFMLADNTTYDTTRQVDVDDDVNDPDGAVRGFRACRDQRPVPTAIARQFGGIQGVALPAIAETIETVRKPIDAQLSELTGGQSDQQRNHTYELQDFFFNVTATAPPPGHPGVQVSSSGITIPPGYALELEFGYVTDTTLVPQVGEDILRPTMLGLTNTTEAGVWGLDRIVYGLTDDENGEDGVSINEPIADGEGGRVNLTEEVLNRNVRNRINDSARSTDARTAGAGLPAGFFFVKSGAPDMQPRLEVKVPNTAPTAVRVVLEDELGEPRAVLMEERAFEGDAPGQPTRDGAIALFPQQMAERGHTQAYAWDDTTTAPRWTQHEVHFSDVGDLPNGVYRVNVTARDPLGQEGYAVRSVLIDQTAPVTLITTLRHAGEAYLRTANDKLPVRWSTIETDSGMREVYVLYRENATGDVGDLTTWKPLFPSDDPAKQPFGKAIPPTVRSAGLTLTTSDTYLLMSVGVDHANNTEGSVNAANLTLALEEGFNAKLFRGPNVQGGYAQVKIDRSRPLLGETSIDGGRELPFQGSDYLFVRAGENVRFSICAADAEGALHSVVLRLDNYGDGVGSLRTESEKAKLAGVCADGRPRYVSDTWHVNNTNVTRFPSGVWQASFDVADLAGNVETVPLASVILDHEPPRVRLEPPVLPVGQSAVKFSDDVKIRLRADDTFGVDEAGITIDASSLSTGANALKVRPARADGIIYLEANFTVNRTGLENGVYPVVVSVPDLAGGTNVTQVFIAVDFKPFEIVPGSLHATNITHNSVVLRWRTTENTSAFAEFGGSPVAFTGRTEQLLNTTTEHAIVVDGLAPSTHYFLRAVSVSPGGFKRTEVIEVDTTTALFLAPVTPKAGDKVSGLVDVTFRGGLLDSSDFVTYTLEVRDSAQKDWTFVTTATRQGELHHLSWNSTRFLDGTSYELRLTAESGRVAGKKDVATVVIGPFTSDNTPPSVLVLGPLLATNETTPTVLAEASDALSGLGAEPAQLLIDGEPVEGALMVDAGSSGRLRLAKNLTTELAQGERVFELLVTDRAGNVARETWRVAIDREAPNVTVQPTRFAPGTAAARLGGTVTLNLTIDDLSGVTLVAADTAALSSQAETRLVRLVNTETWQGTFPVTSAEPSATKRVAIRAVDLAGNTRTLTVDIPVDNVAPTLRSTSLVETRHTRVVISVPADEPILVNGTATAPRSPAVTAATREAQTTATITFAGLLPSRTYSYKLTAEDRAGNPVDLQGSFATEKDVIAPTSVGRLSVVDLLNGTLRLSWGAADDDVGVSHYRIYRSDDGVTFQAISEVTGTSYDDGGLPYEKTYVYKVAAIDHGANEGVAEERLTATVTAVPTITLGVVTPTVGSASTTFRYTLTYTHPGERPAAYVRVILDGVPQNMTLESGDPKTGAVYVYETRLAPHKRDAPHTYAFEASDGRYTVRFPEDGSPVRGPLVSGDALADGPIEGFAAFAQRVPLSGAALTALGLVAALGIAAAVSRKKKGGSK